MIYNSDAIVPITAQVYVSFPPFVRRPLFFFKKKKIYPQTTYLALLAQTAYFLPTAQPMQMKVTIVVKRLWISSAQRGITVSLPILVMTDAFSTVCISSTVAAHLLAVILILIAALGTFVQVAHRNERKRLHLVHPPGTIACAVSAGANANLEQMVARLDESEMMNRMTGDATFGGVGRRKSVFSPLLPKRGSLFRGASVGGEPKSA